MSELYRFSRFVISGGVAAGVNVVSRWLLSLITSFEVAVFAAYLIGMVTAFLLARRFVFRPSSTTAVHQFRRFALVNVIAFAQVWIISVGLARLMFPVIGFTWHSETMAHMIGVGSPVITSYFAHRWYSFG